MSLLAWAFGVGLLLLGMALSSAHVARMPLTPAVVYLVLGAIVGPAGLGWLRIDFVRDAKLLELLGEGAVAVSLFLSGLKLRRPPTDASWRPAYVLVGPVMLVSIAGLASFGHAALGLPLGAAVLLGAVLSPTDPVLASAVAVERSSDRDASRFALTAESGLNDGAMMPFVALGLSWVEKGCEPGPMAALLAKKLLWAIPAGLLLGFFLGRLLGRAAVALRARHRETDGPNDFLALAIIALSFSIAEASGASGFLAVFAAGVGLRSAEVSVVRNDPHPDHDPEEDGAHPPAEELVEEQRISGSTVAHPAVAAGVVVTDSLTFGETLERALEVAVVLLVGATVVSRFSGAGLLVAALLFFVIRPVSCELFLRPTALSRRQRRLVGFLGIRGIGSVYALAYAIVHGLPSSLADELAGLTLTVVAASIVLHGVAVTPLVDAYRAAEEGGPDERDA